MTNSKYIHLIVLALSAFLAMCSTVLLVICLLSASYRYVKIGVPLDEKDKYDYYFKSHGLFRFCYFEELLANDVDPYLCYTRTGTSDSFHGLNNYSEFEYKTAVLLALATGTAALSNIAALVSLKIWLAAAIHCILLALSTILSLIGMTIYTYNCDLLVNKQIREQGRHYQYQYGWAYYCTFGCCGGFLISTILSAIYISFLYTKSNKQQKHRIAVNLGS